MTHPKAFSLVELSIVLVILGLLVGGILAGQSLIRGAELRSALSEVERYRTSAATFRDKYFAMPGDISNASAFWASAANGNRNGLLEHAASAGTAGETFGFWQHLALAGLIEGTYTGLAGAGSIGDAIIGTNVPRARMDNAGWSARGEPRYTFADGNWFEGNYGNLLLFGAKRASEHTIDPILKAEEAWNLDTKTDDGRPGLGGVRSLEMFAHATAGCSNPAASTTVAIAATSAYDLDNAALACSLIFNLGL